MRDSSIDTLKGMMIVLVVVGHYIEHLMYQGDIRLFYGMIYLVHMPVFVYLSGVTFRLSQEKRSTGFIIFCILAGQLAYSVVSFFLYGDFWADYWVLWYLYAMLFWRELTPRIRANKWMLLPAILLALLWGVLPQNDVWRFSRIVAFYPYFLAGYLQLHTSIPRKGGFWLLCCAAIAGAGMILTQGTQTVETVALLYNNQSYAVLGQTVPEGMFYKVLLYCVGFAAILFLLRMRFSNGTLEKWGRYSILVYLVHGLLAKILSKGLQISSPALLGLLAIATVAMLGTAPAAGLLRKSYTRISAIWVEGPRDA